MIIEICNQAIRETGIKQAIKDGFFMIWDEARIKSAFSFGRGTMEDFNRYKKDNSPRYCTIIDIDQKELEALYPIYSL